MNDRTADALLVLGVDIKAFVKINHPIGLVGLDKLSQISRHRAQGLHLSVSPNKVAIQVVLVLRNIGRQPLVNLKRGQVRARNNNQSAPHDWPIGNLFRGSGACGFITVHSANNHDNRPRNIRLLNVDRSFKRRFRCQR